MQNLRIYTNRLGMRFKMNLYAYKCTSDTKSSFSKVICRDLDKLYDIYCKFDPLGIRDILGYFGFLLGNLVYELGISSMILECNTFSFCFNLLYTYALTMRRRK